MIIELLFNLIFGLVNFIISFIPSGYNLPNWFFSFYDVVSNALAFFPRPVFIIVISNVGFWLAAHMGWAVIEWVYKKVPGVD